MHIQHEKNITKKNNYKILYYNLLKRRTNKINDYFNKIVKYIHNNYNTRKAIIVGYNINWKTGVNMGKTNNRRFYNIPYATLLHKLNDKFGNKLIITEESYSSKCDAVGMEEICKHKTYMGKRLKRGLFSSSVKKLINADINGAINIMRKIVKVELRKEQKICNPKKVNVWKRSISGKAERPVSTGK